MYNMQRLGILCLPKKPTVMGYIGVILGLHWGYIGVILGIMEKKMETTTMVFETYRPRLGVPMNVGWVAVTEHKISYHNGYIYI